jgi:hypothetical protein
MEEKSHDKKNSEQPDSGVPSRTKPRWLTGVFRRKNKADKRVHKEAEIVADSSEEQGDVAELISDAADLISDAAAAGTEVIKKNRWVLLLLFRVMFYGFCSLVALLLIAYTCIKIFVKPDDLKRIIKENVEIQTGGKLDIGAVFFDPATGIRITNVEFYAPEPGDARGMLEGGNILPVPLANFEALNIGYSVPKLLAAQVNINAMQLVEPQVHLKVVDGIWNFQGIMDYRKRKFPSEEKVVEEAGSSSLDSYLLFSPTLIYMPIQILAQNIGIKNLRLDLIEESKGKISKIIVTNGLSFDIGAFWHKKTSNFWFNLVSLFDKPFELDVKEAKRDEEGNVISDLEQTLLVNTALILHAELSDFANIKFDFANRITNLTTPIAGYQDIGNFIKMRAKVADTLKTVDIETLEVDFADALSYALNGKIEIDSFDLKAITLKLVQKFNLDLENAMVLATPFVKGIKGDGSISFDKFKIDGVIESEKLANFDKGFALPYVSGVVWLENIWVDIPETGVSMQPISGDVSMAAGPALNGTGSQADIAMNINVPKFNLEQKLKVGNVSAGIENLALNSTIRALWPEMLVPVLKMNVQAERVVAKGANIAPVDVPLFFDLDAEGGKDLSRISANLNAELTDLAEFSLNLNCTDVCQRFRINTQTRLDSFEKVHSIAFPLGAGLNLTDYMPTKMSGSLDFQFSARGTIPDPLTTPVPELLKQLDTRLNSQVNLNKLSAQIPFLNTNIRGFDNRIAINGSHNQQKIDITQKIDSLTLTYENIEAKKSVPVELSKYQIVSEITNDVTEPLDLERIKEIMNTSIELDVYFAKLSSDGLLPMPIRELQLYIEGSQSKLVDITVDEITLKVPNLGVDALVKAETMLGPDYMPTKAKVDIKANVVHNGTQILPEGMKTNGGVGLNLVVETPDLKNVSIDGEAKFDRFYLTLPGATEAETIVVEDIRGQIPFKQVINIPDTLALIERLTAAPKTDTGLAGATAPGSVEQSTSEVEKDVDVEAIDLSGVDARKTGLNTAVNKYLSKQNNKAQKDANKIAMVDYGAVRPYFPDRRPLSIQRILARNLEFTRMEFDIVLKQNWFGLSQFVMNFLGGKIQGDLQLSFDPLPRALKTAVHMTRLDTRKILDRFPDLKSKSGEGFNVFGSNPYIDGTIHLDVDVPSKDFSGGIEITSIGKEQMKMMLYYIDPYEKNENIADIRKALILGDVRNVSIPFNNGEIGMDVDVRLVGVPFPTPKLSRFPANQILENFVDLSKVNMKPEDNDVPVESVPPVATSQPVPTGAIQ